MLLLPQPKSVEQLPGSFPLGDGLTLFLPPNLAEPEWLAVERLRGEVAFRRGIRIALDRSLHRDGLGAVYLAISPLRNTSGRVADGYELLVQPDRITVIGRSDTGLLNGIRTLSQILTQADDEIPCMRINDLPDFERRGVYFDVSRGRIPRLETFQWLLDFLADLKVNEFQLYIEHPFAFRCDPRIAQNNSALTAEDILQIQRWCQQRRIDFVPSLQSFGHMAGVLSLPEYRRFADVEPTKPFAELTWHERMSGATINVEDPEALGLLARLHEEYLPLFDSTSVNFCADETYDLGKGKTASLAEQIGKPALYLKHINWLNQVARDYGKQMMFWGDIILHHPEHIANIPKDAMLLNWAYHAGADYESTRLFAEHGLQVGVCPGTKGWNTLLNGFNNADTNIRGHAKAGKKYGASLLLNTDWGDHGHFNMLAASLHGFALGAAMAWHEGAPNADTFDRAFNLLVFGTADGEETAALRAQSFAADNHSSWTMFYHPLSDQKAVEKFTSEDAERLIDAGAAADSVLLADPSENWVREELALGSRMNALHGTKVLLTRALAGGRNTLSNDLKSHLLTFADQLEVEAGRYAYLWRARSRESELGLILAKLNGLVKEARLAAKN